MTTEISNYELIKKIVVEQLGLSREEAQAITGDTSYTDCGADSLDDIELIMAFEEHFGFEIEDSEAESLNTINDVLHLIEHKNAPIDDTAISDVQATKVLPEGDNASEINTDSFKVICSKTYTITIKGQEFVLTEAEYVELEEAMRLVDE